MSQRIRYRFERRLTTLVSIALLPVALPMLGLAIWLDNVGRAQELPRPRRSCWFWRIWWWYGYHGLYQLGWWTTRPVA